MFGLSSAGINQGSPLEASGAPLTSTHQGFSQFSPNIHSEGHIFICGCINRGLPGCQIKNCYQGDSKMLLLARLLPIPKTTLLAIRKLEHGLGEEGWEGRVKEGNNMEKERGEKSGHG